MFLLKLLFLKVICIVILIIVILFCKKNESFEMVNSKYVFIKNSEEIEVYFFIVIVNVIKLIILKS